MNKHLNLEKILSINQRKTLKKIVQIFIAHKIQFQISGGLAAIIYGAERPLYDIDIEVYKKDIQKVRDIFQTYISKDFYHLQDEILISGY